MSLASWSQKEKLCSRKYSIHKNVYDDSFVRVYKIYVPRPLLSKIIVHYVPLKYYLINWLRNLFWQRNGELCCITFWCFFFFKDY